MLHSPISYLTDPILRAPTLACMLMCVASSVVGVLVYLRRQSLLGESLAHASYPGVILGVLVSSGLSLGRDGLAPVIILAATASAWLGLLTIRFLSKTMKVPQDASLCFVLSSFFGLGLTLASRVQVTHTRLYSKVQMFLYGQAATMTDFHIFLYGGLVVIVLGLTAMFYKELQTINFDRAFAKSLNLPVRRIEGLFSLIVVLSIVISIRSVGVVLISAMLIAPAVSSRQYTERLHHMFGIAAFFGLLSGFLGNYLSVEISRLLMDRYPGESLVLPTGPSIVIVAASLCLFSLLFAPQRGIAKRFFRVAKFRYACIKENLLKALWRGGPQSNMTVREIRRFQNAPKWYLKLVLWDLKRQGWLEKSGITYSLTEDGQKKASHIVRLHRLWEVYLADYLGIGQERVHRSAEEMEHIITPDLELRLSELLCHPRKDPHNQPIPQKGETLP